jgi:hypothetical protein
LIGGIKGKREKRTNGIAAYRQGKVIAPMRYEGSMTTAFFNEYLKNGLLPELNLVVIMRCIELVEMDNASFHKSPLVKEYLEEMFNNVFAGIFPRIESDRTHLGRSKIAGAPVSCAIFLSDRNTLLLVLSLSKYLFSSQLFIIEFTIYKSRRL